MAVLGTTIFKPGSIEAHEIAKSPGVGIPRMLDERGKSGRQYLGQTFFAGIVESAGKQQGSRIVIDAIAVRPIRYRMHRVLEQTRIVAHGQEMAQLHVRRRRAVRDRDRPGPRDYLEPVAMARILE